MMRIFATALACATFSVITGVSLPLPQVTVPLEGAKAAAKPAPRGTSRRGDREDRFPLAGLVRPVSDIREDLSISLASIASTAANSIEPTSDMDIGDSSDAALFEETDEERTNEEKRPTLSREEICQIVREVAIENDLPIPLFMRLIWQESRFRPGVVSHAGAQGIAQFMPGTAADRGLEDPFDPIQALPASADFVRELVLQFGNFGLAAAAYNGGPRRVSEWLAGKGSLPKETRDYVVHITGRNAEHWAEGTIHAQPDPEVFTTSDCRLRPLRAAMALFRRTVAENKAALERKAAEQKQAEEKWIWRVQLAGDWTEKKALARVADLKKKYPKILGKASPKVVAVKGAGKSAAKKTLVRLAADTRSEAEELCKRLKEAGGNCTVLKDPA
jgi:hypothetical protein